MKLSSLIENEIGSWPTTSSLNRVLRMSLELAKRYEDAPMAHMCGECEHTWMRHVDTDTSEQDAALAGMCGQRVRIVLDKEG